MSLDDAAKLLEHGPQIVLAFVAFAVVAFVIKSRGAKQRFLDHQARQQAVAATLGFRGPTVDPAKGMLTNIAARVVDGEERLGRFERLRGRSTIHVLFDGERDGMKMTLFLHTLSTDTVGNDTSTIACCESPGIDVPPFTLGPKLESFFGAPDAIQFPERPKFAASYTLTSTYAVRIHDAFTPRVLDFFEANSGWSVEGLNDRLLVWRDDVMEPDARLAAFVAEAAAIAKVFRKQS